MLFRSVLVTAELLVELGCAIAAPITPTCVEWEHTYRQEPRPDIVVEKEVATTKRDMKRQGAQPDLPSLRRMIERDRFGTTYRTREQWRTDGNVFRIDYNNGLEVPLPQNPPQPDNANHGYRMERDGLILSIRERNKKSEKDSGYVDRSDDHDALTEQGEGSLLLRSLLLGMPSTKSLLSSSRIRSKFRTAEGRWQLNIEQAEIANPTGKPFAFPRLVHITLTPDGKRICRIERLDKQGNIWQKITAFGNHDIGDGRILPTSVQVILYGGENTEKRISNTEIYRLHRSQIGSKVDITPLRETLPAEPAFITDRRFSDESEQVSYTTSGGLLSENEVQKKWDALQRKKRLAIFWPQFLLTTAIAGTLIGVLCAIRRG